MYKKFIAGCLAAIYVIAGIGVSETVCAHEIAVMSETGEENLNPDIGAGDSVYEDVQPSAGDEAGTDEQGIEVFGSEKESGQDDIQAVQKGSGTKIKLRNPRRSSNGYVTFDYIYFGKWSARNGGWYNLRWKVLEVKGNDAFLVADRGAIYLKGSYDGSWKNSNIRKWLNGYSGYNNFWTHLTYAERNAIRTVKVDGCRDKVFILSKAEATKYKYGFSPSAGRKDRSRKVKYTESQSDPYYAGAVVGTWWLRSKGSNKYNWQYVRTDGSIDTAGSSINGKSRLVLPAMHLNLRYTNYYSYAGSERVKIPKADRKKKKPKETNISKAKISGIRDMEYTGKKITLKHLKVRLNGRKLKLGRDYKVSYKHNIKQGKATVTIQGRGNYKGRIPKKCKIRVIKNHIYTVGNFKYRVKNANQKGRGTVELVGTTYKRTDGRFKKLTVKDKIKLGGKKYKVISVGDGAFAGYAGLRKINIGKYVEKIGKYAFVNCTSIKNIKITTKKLKKVGSGAFFNTSEKARLELPYKKVKKYTKLLYPNQA